MKKVFLFLGIFSGFTLFGQTPIELADCLQWAQNQHPSARQAPLIDQYQEQSVQIYKRNYLPQLEVNMKATYQSDVVSLPIEFPGLDIPEVPKDQYQATLELSQLVWDGGISKAGIALAKAQGQVEHSQQQLEQWQVQDQTAQLFFQLVLLKKQAASQYLGLDNLQQQESRIKAGIENGIAVPSDWSRLRLKMLDLESALRQNATLQAQLCENLSLLTGKTIEAKDSLVVPVLELPSSSAVARPELALLEAQKELTEAQDLLILGQNRPKARLFATGGYGQPGLNFLNDGPSFFAIVGAGVQIPLAPFYTGTQHLERSKLRIQQERIVLQKEAFLQGNTLQQGLALQQIEQLGEQIEVDQQKLVLQTEITEVAKNQLENGILTVGDYLIEWNAKQLVTEQKLLHEIQQMQAIFAYRLLLGNPY